jgi:hypothetical protein
VARKSYQSRSLEILQTHTQLIRRKSYVCLPEGGDEDDFFHAHRLLQCKGLDLAIEEEAASEERVAQSEAKAPTIQPKRRVLMLQLADIQVELQCH